MSRLHDFYTEQVRDSLREKFGYKNGMEIPKLEKIVINIGVGEATENSKAVDAAANDLAAITGQRPMICKAHKSLAAWKIREGMPLGCKVTIRGEKMYEFLDRLINIALPRVRDFRGISDTSFDGRTGVTNTTNRYSFAGCTPTCAPVPTSNGRIYREAPDS